MTDTNMTAAPRSQWWDVWDQFKTHKGAVMGLGFLIFITLFCMLGPVVWDVDPGKLNIRNKNLRPIINALWDADAKVAWANPMGTDNLGRDIMTSSSGSKGSARTRSVNRISSPSKRRK